MRGSTAIALVLVATASAPAATLPPTEIRSLFDQANRAFRQANAAADDATRESGYEQAILSLERILNEGGLRNAKLYYNLANAYLLRGDVGRAILNYRRAQRLDPAWPEVRKNLAFARSRRVDRVGVPTEERVRRTLFFWHYDLSPSTRVWLASVGAGALFLALAVAVWRGRSAGLSVAATLGLLLCLANAGSVTVEALTQGRTAHGVIIATESVARQGDGPNYPPSFKDPLHAGTEFTLIEHRGAWFHIRLADGSEGWIADGSAGII